MYYIILFFNEASDRTEPPETFQCWAESIYSAKQQCVESNGADIEFVWAFSETRELI